MARKKESKKGQEHCVIKDPLDYAGGTFLVLGFLVAGVLLIFTGTEMIKSSPDADLMKTVYGITAGFILLSMVGYYTTMPDVLCNSTDRGPQYFGGMFILLGFVGVAGFTIGIALNMANAANTRDFSFLVGVFLLVLALGWLICNAATHMGCDDSVFVHTIGHYLVVIFLIVSGGLYFPFGHAYGEGDMDTAGHVSMVIGISYCLLAIGLLLCKCL